MNTPEPLVIVPGKLYRCKLLDHGWWVNDFYTNAAVQLPIGATLLCVRADLGHYTSQPVFLAPNGTLVAADIVQYGAWEEVNEP